MKIVVIGGSGRIGSKLVSILRSKGHEVLAASPDSGVNTITGEGLDAALAGTRHHVALSVVGTDRIGRIGRIGRIAQDRADGRSVRVSGAMFQPILSADVVSALADIALGPPLNTIVEVGGPESFPMNDLVRRVLQAKGDSREVITDEHARYFGAELDDESLVASPNARLGARHFADWLRESAQ